MKANHNSLPALVETIEAVLAVSKVLNLKANHNRRREIPKTYEAVLAVSKVLNLKANHNGVDDVDISLLLY